MRARGIYIKNLVEDYFELYLEDENDELEKELDKTDDEIEKKLSDKAQKTNEKKSVGKDIHESNPVFKFFNGNSIKLVSVTLIKKLMSKEVGVLTKIGYSISITSLFLIGTISESSKYIKERKTRQEAFRVGRNGSRIVRELLSIDSRINNYLLQENILKNATASIKVLYFARKIISAMAKILIQIYGGATQIFYVLMNIALAVLSAIFFSIGVLLIKETYKDKDGKEVSNEPIFQDITSRIKGILKDEGSAAFGNPTKKFDIIKSFLKMCFKFTFEMVKYIPKSIGETLKGAWDFIKNIPKMIKSFFEHISPEELYDSNVYKEEEILKEFFNPINILKGILSKFKSLGKAFIFIAPAILLVVLATKKLNIKIPFISDVLEFFKNPAKQAVEQVTQATGDTKEKITDKDASNLDMYDHLA